MESYLFWTIWRHGEVCEVYKSSCCIFFSIAWFYCVWQRNELKLWGSAWTGTSFFSSSCLNKVSSSSSCIFQRLLYLIPFINWLVFTPVYGRFSHRSGWCLHQFACHQRLARGVWECLLFCTHTLTHTHWSFWPSGILVVFCTHWYILVFLTRELDERPKNLLKWMWSFVPDSFGLFLFWSFRFSGLSDQGRQCLLRTCRFSLVFQTMLSACHDPKQTEVISLWFFAFHPWIQHYCY